VENKASRLPDFLRKTTMKHPVAGCRLAFCTTLQALMASACVLAPPAVQAAARQQLSGHVTLEMAKAPVIGRVPAATQMNLVIGLPVKDKQALARDIEGVSDPASPTYRQFLTLAQFADRYGASAEDYEKVIAWATSHNLKATRHANRLLVAVNGSVADIEKVLNVHLNLARRANGSVFHMPDAEPSLELDVPIEHISNLDDYVLPRRASGSGPGGSYTGQDFRNAYASCTTLDGTGQTIGILMLDGFAQSDVTSYFSSKSLGMPLSVQIDGPPGSGATPGVEGTLDVEMALSMAPGAQVVAFTGDVDTALANMSNREDIKQVSSSWFTLVDPNAQKSIATMAMDGVSFFQASGDSGGLPPNYKFSNSDFRLLPSVTNVGGTQLNMNGAGASYGTETAWSGSSGGILTNIPIPSYQVGLATPANGASSVWRNMPDIAAEAAYVAFYFNGGNWTGDGTSAAAPLMAGFMALVNQNLAAAGKGTIGPANPALYAAAADYGGTFNDITQGSNGLFKATAGYNLVTGLGSPNCGLIWALAWLTPGGPPPPPPQCGLNEKWCLKFEPARCVPINECLVTPPHPFSQIVR